MNSPFEELEYLADYLPDEGEAVIVVRKDGELVCEAFQREKYQEGITDPEFYGRLIQCERTPQLPGHDSDLDRRTLVLLDLCRAAFHIRTRLVWLVS